MHGQSVVRCDRSLLSCWLASHTFLSRYARQDYIDSMEGATLSGRQCAAKVGRSAPLLQANHFILSYYSRCFLPHLTLQVVDAAPDLAAVAMQQQQAVPA